jgi:hypothetical protein
MTPTAETHRVSGEVIIWVLLAAIIIIIIATHDQPPSTPTTCIARAVRLRR